MHRLAFDTIGLCAFNYRFNEFYMDHPHEFASQMAEVLVESGKRASRTAVENHLRIFSAAQNEQNIASMHKLCDELVADRKANPKPEVNDLLNIMLTAKDPVTGEGLSDENIRFQMVTFLVRPIFFADLVLLVGIWLMFLRLPGMKRRVALWPSPFTTY